MLHRNPTATRRKLKQQQYETARFHYIDMNVVEGAGGGEEGEREEREKMHLKCIQ